MNDTTDRFPLAPLIDIREAATLLGISTRHLQRLTVAGDFESVKLGRSVRYRRGDILNAITGSGSRQAEKG
jgi:excisionase family DNA binding protein